MERLEFKGLWGFTSVCGVSSDRAGEHTTIVVMTDLPDNPGTGVTNAVETIAGLVWALRLGRQPAETIRWFEHHPPGPAREETFAEVTFARWPGDVTLGEQHDLRRRATFATPSWRRLHEARFIACLRALVGPLDPQPVDPEPGGGGP